MAKVGPPEGSQTLRVFQTGRSEGSWTYQAAYLPRAANWAAPLIPPGIP